MTTTTNLLPTLLLSHEQYTYELPGDRWENLPTLGIVVDIKKMADVDTWLTSLNIPHEEVYDECTVWDLTERGFSVWYMKVSDVPKTVYAKLVAKFGSPLDNDRFTAVVSSAESDRYLTALTRRLEDFPILYPIV